MTFTEFALISIGHISLALTFVLGLLVGCSLSKKRMSHGYGNEGTSQEWWDYAAGCRFEECPARCKPGCSKQGTEAGADECASG
jgi:hypothetical protein